MKKLLFIALLVLSVIFSSFALVACEEDTDATATLDAPVITLTDNVISWSAVTDATSYEVYCDSASVLVQTGTSYTITNTAEGSYSYYVVASATIGSVSVKSSKSNSVTYTVTASSGGDDSGSDDGGSSSLWSLSGLLEDSTLGFVFNATAAANNYDTNMYMTVSDHDGDTNNTLILTLTNTSDKDIFAKGKVAFEDCTDQTAKYGEITLPAGKTVTVYIDVTGIDATSIWIFPDLGEQEVAGEASFTIDTCEFANITTLAKPTIELDGAEVSWTAVEGAEGYDVYCNGEFVVSQTALSYTATDTDEGIYKYTVVATSTADGYVDSDSSNEVSYIVGSPAIPEVSLGAWTTTDNEFVLDATGDSLLAVTYTGVESGTYKNIYSALTDYNSVYTTVVVTITNTTDSAMTMRIGLDDGGTDYGNYDNLTIVIAGNATVVFSIDISNTLYTPTSIKLYPDTDANSKSEGAFTLDSVVFYTEDTAPVAISAPVLELDGNEIKWTAVDNATSYDIYCNGEFVVNQENVSYVIDQSADGIYSYTVVACTTADGYLDSAASTAVKYTIGEVVAADPSLTIDYPALTDVDGVYTHSFTATDTKTWDNTVGITVNDLDVDSYNRVKVTYTNTGDIDLIIGTKIASDSSDTEVAYGGDATIAAGESTIVYINIDMSALGFMQIFPDYGTSAGEATFTFGIEFYYEETTTDPDAGDTTAQPTLGDWWVSDSDAIVVDETLGYTFTATEEASYGMCIGASVVTYDSDDFNRAKITITNTGSTAIYISANAELLDADSLQLAVAYGGIEVPVGETVIMYINLEDVTSGDVFVVSQFVLFPNVGTTAGDASFTVDSLSFYYDAPTTTDPTDPTDPVDPTPAITSVTAYTREDIITDDAVANDGQYTAVASVEGTVIDVTLTVTGVLTASGEKTYLAFGLYLYDNGTLLVDGKVNSSSLAYDPTVADANGWLSYYSIDRDYGYTIEYLGVEYTVNVEVVYDMPVVAVPGITSVTAYTREDIITDDAVANDGQYTAVASVEGTVIDVTLTVTGVLTASGEKTYLAFGLYLYDNGTLLVDGKVNSSSLAYDPTVADANGWLSYYSIDRDYGYTIEYLGVEYTVNVEVVYDMPVADIALSGIWTCGVVSVDETLGYTYTTYGTSNDYSSQVGGTVENHDVTVYEGIKITVTNTGSEAITLEAKVVGVNLVEVDGIEVTYSGTTLAVGETGYLYFTVVGSTDGVAYDAVAFTIFCGFGDAADVTCSFTIDAVEGYNN